MIALLKLTSHGIYFEILYKIIEYIEQNNLV